VGVAMLKKILPSILFVFFLSSSFYSQTNWQQTNGPYGGSIADIKQDSRGNYYAASDVGLFISKDGCESWEKIDIPGLGNDGIKEIYFHPSGKMFLCGWNDYLFTSDENISNWQRSSLKRQINIDSHGNLFATNQKTIYISTDIGKSWNPLITLNKYIYFFCMVKDSNLVVGTDTIYYSNNLGKSWQKSNIHFNWDSDFIVDKNKNIYFISEWNLYKSSDNGKSWKMIRDHITPPPLPLPPDYHLYFNRTFVDENNTIYLCSDEVFISSTDGGTSWEQIGKVPYPVNKFWQDSSNNFFCLGGVDGIYKYDRTNKTMIKKSYGLRALQISQLNKWKENIICYAFGKNFITYDQGNSWQQLNTPEYSEIYFINSKDRIFVENSHGIYYSDDAVNWNEIKYPDPQYDDLGLIASINDIILLFDLRNILYRTTDYGTTWTKIFSPPYPYGYKSLNISSIDEMFFSYGSVLYKSTDNGLTWKVDAALDKTIITISKSPWGNVYLSTEDDLYENTFDGWKKLDIGFYYEDVHKIIYSPTNQMYLLGNDLLVSIDFGKSFSVVDMNVNIPTAFIFRDFNINRNGILFLSQDYNGIWKTSYNGNASVIPSRSILQNNYPNPFNNQTTIEFYINEPGMTSISIYDLIGRKVEALFQNNVQQGFYKTTWQPKSLASGIYFYRLQSGSFSQTKKFVLMK
jgi:photosystem II stability/assembly factor-like uncharacterized protein